MELGSAGLGGGSAKRRIVGAGTVWSGKGSNRRGVGSTRVGATTASPSCRPNRSTKLRGRFGASEEDAAGPGGKSRTRARIGSGAGGGS